MKNLYKSVAVFCIFFLNFNVLSQDSYYEDLMRFRESFYSVFFTTKLSDNKYIYSAKRETISHISTGDSLTVPRKTEMWGMQYFKKRPVCIKTNLKKSDLPKAAVSVEGSYFLFKQNRDNYHKYIDTVSEEIFSEELEAYLDSSFRSDVEKSLKDTSNWIFVYSISGAKGNKRYYLSSMKSTVRVKMKIRRKDLKFISERAVSRSSLEIWAISSYLLGQYCDPDYTCYELYEISDWK